MDWLQAITLALVQGITEPFPVSSLGHTVLVPHLLKWGELTRSGTFLPFLTFLHFGTLLALALLFGEEWKAILTGLFKKDGSDAQRKSRKMIFLLIIATIPAIIFGGTLERELRLLFANPVAVSIFLILNGCLLLAASLFRAASLRRERTETSELTNLSPAGSFIIGIWQALALFPGISRSGAAIVGGLSRNLDYFNAGKYSLLLAQPIILAATVRELWELRHVSATSLLLVQSFAGSVIAGITAWGCSFFLLRTLRRKGDASLNIFALYCLLFGGFCLIYFLARRT